MRHILFGILLVASASLLHAQTMRVTPDSCYAGTGVSVTIVGIGTKFESTKNVSGLQVYLEQSGNKVGLGTFPSLVNDSTIVTELGGGTVGWYDLAVIVTDTSEHTFTQDSAFHVVAPPPVPPSIAGIYPSSAYDSTVTNVIITPEGTNLGLGSLPTILFQKNGITYFTTQADSIVDNSYIAATVTVPRSAPAETYDIVAYNSFYSDTGKSMFTVLGPLPDTSYVPMSMTPDTGYPNQQLSVTIVGSGTMFSPTINTSMASVMLERLDIPFATASSITFVNDSTIRASIQVADNMYVGFLYDLVIVINDTPQQTYIQSSAFLVTQPPPTIAYVSPSSAYNSLLDTVQIQGLYSSFLNGPTPTISFQLHGTTEFTARTINVLTNSSIRAFMTIPSAAPAGVYDVIASNGFYSDTGKQEFTVLGPEAIVTLAPDSGAGSTMFDVSIVGQNTNFAPTTGASLPLTMGIYLNQNGVTYYQTTADTVFSGVLAHAVFTLPDSIAPGIYDAEVFGYTYSNSYYDLHTSFLVTPSVTIGIHSPPVADPGDSVTINLTGTLANFIYQGNQLVTTVRLVNASEYITAASVTVINDTTLSALFEIPDTTNIGNYDIDIIEPGTNRTLIGTNMFNIVVPLVVTETTSFPEIINSIHIFPNPAQDNAAISFMMAAPSPVKLLIYDALGRTVAMLCDRTLGAGVQNFSWSSDRVPDGSYFYEIITGDNRYGGRIVVQH